MINKCLTLIIFLTLTTSIYAQPQRDLSEPEIVIRATEDKVIHEYRVNGFLYAVKIVPKNGVPYYLVAEDGSENFTRIGESNFKVPKWEILKW